RRLHQPAGLALVLRSFARHRLPVILFKHWLWIEAIDLGKPAIHKKKDDMLCLRLELRILNHPGARRGTLRRSCKCVGDQGGKTQHAETSAHSAKGFATSNRPGSRNVNHESSKVQEHLSSKPSIDEFEFVRTQQYTRILFPRSDRFTAYIV